MPETPKNPPKFKYTELKNVFGAVLRILAYGFTKKPLLSTGLLISMAISTLLPILSMWLGGRLIDELINLVTVTGELSPSTLILVFWLLGLMLLETLARKTRWYLDYNLEELMRLEIEKDVTRKLAYLDIEYYDNPEINDLINRVRDKYRWIPSNFLRSILRTSGHLIKLVSSAIVLIGLSPLIVAIATLSIIPEILSNAVYSKRSWKIFNDWTERRRDAYATNRSLVDENRLKELRTFRLREYFYTRFLDLYGKWVQSQIKINNKKNIIGSAWSFLGTAGHGVNLILIIQRVVSGNITIGMFTFYRSNLNRLDNAVYNIFNNLTGIYERGLYMVEIFKFLDLPQKIENGSICLSDIKTPPTIKFENVSFKYPQTDNYVLENFNLEIKPGEHLAIVGENGTGKTTLIKLLMRFYDVTKGNIFIDGNNLRDLDVESWYSMVGTLFQDYNFYHFDAKTNIGVGDDQNIDDLESIIQASKEAAAHEFIEKYDNQYDQILSKTFSGGINPSIGQQQKIALARAFFRSAPVLILDEPTSNIDPKAEFEIFEKLFEFAHGKTVIIISHRFSTVRNAEKIIVLDGGKIIEEGTHEDLMGIKGGKYKTAFELQKKGYE
ncbi:ABC transporter ATP-binding protein [Patescibacteria group bacterium]